MRDQLQGKRERGEKTPGGEQSPQEVAWPAKGKDLARRRATMAWEWVDTVVKKQDKSFNKRYGTLARKLPSYLQVNGLGQTLAFLFAKGGTDQAKPEGLLLQQLGSCLKDLVKSPMHNPIDIMLGLEPAQYRRATQELMALAEWLKRFADGRLEKED